MNEHLEEFIDELRGSLRRAEHTYYVSLKYTRTVDMIRTLLERYIGTYTLGIEVLLNYYKDKGLIDSIPDNRVEKINLAKQQTKDLILIEGFNRILLFRRVMRASFGKTEEFRRHVTMSVNLEGNKLEYHIDNLGEIYQEVVIFVKEVMKIVHEKEDD